MQTFHLLSHLWSWICFARNWVGKSTSWPTKFRQNLGSGGCMHWTSAYRSRSIPCWTNLDPPDSVSAREKKWFHFKMMQYMSNGSWNPRSLICHSVHTSQISLSGLVTGVPISVIRPRYDEVIVLTTGSKLSIGYWFLETTAECNIADGDRFESHSV